MNPDDAPPAPETWAWLRELAGSVDEDFERAVNEEVLWPEILATGFSCLNCPWTASDHFALRDSSAADTSKSMYRNCTVVLTENSSRGKSPRAINGQAVKIARRPSIVQVGVDG